MRSSSLYLALLCLAGAAQAVPLNRLSLTKQALEACYRQQYDSSWNMLLPLAEDSTDPGPVSWQASIIQVLCYETGSKAMVDSFHKLNNRAESLCRRRLAANDRDTFAYFYMGMCRLNRASSYAWEKKTSSALDALLPAPGPLRAALRLDPAFTDAGYDLGMIEYFKAQGDKYLLGLGILGSKPRAFELVRRSANDSGLCGPAARLSLAWMLGQERRYAEALEQSRQLLKRYPGNRMILRSMRDICFRQGDYEAVLAIGRELDDNVRVSYPDNKYYLSENWLVMAKAYNRLGQPESCAVLLDRVLAWEKFEHEVPWLRTYVAEAKGLKRNLKK